MPKPKPPPKAGVEDAAGVAPPPPNKPPGFDAGVLDAPPKRPPEPPVLAPAEPKRPPLAGVLEVLLFAVPKRDGVALPVEGAAPNSDLFGVLLLPPLLLLLPCWPNVKLMMAAVEESSGVCVDGEEAVIAGEITGNARMSSRVAPVDGSVGPSIDELQGMRVNGSSSHAHQYVVATQKLDKQCMGQALAPVNCCSHLPGAAASRPLVPR